MQVEELNNIASFGYWVERRRKALDLTRASLATQVGCSPVTIKKIERDERRPSLEMAELLADHLRIPAAERNQFLQMARGKFVASMPSPLEAVPPPAFARPQADVPNQENSPFVARERELAHLNESLDRVLAGQGQVVFVGGEAGSGKTALIGEFARRAQAKHVDLVVVGGNCNAHTGQGDPYLPFRQILELLTGDFATRATAGVINPEHARRLEALTPHTIRALLEFGPELIDVLVPGPALVSRAETIGLDALRLNPLRQVLARRQAGLTQQYLFEQYCRVLQALVQQTPLLVVLDDLQWADTGSLNLLFHLGRRLAESRLLVIGTYRSIEVTLGRDGERHPLETVVNELQRQFGSTPIQLDQADNRKFVDTLLDTEPNYLGADFREALYHQTGGHALFTVEMLRGLQERGDLVQGKDDRWVAGPAINWQMLPARVEGVIGERIGRLPETLRETLKIASVEGEEFTAEVVAQVQGIDARELVRQLGGVLDQKHHLVRGQGIQRLEGSGERLSRYRFQHILFQKYLYDSLDEAERVYLHEAVGNTLKGLYREQTGEVDLELARHFEAAGLSEQAIGYLRQAGERAVRLSANEAALAHFKKALTLLDTLPGTPARVELALTLQIAIGQVMIGARGFAAPEVEHAFLRARELCQGIRTEDSREFFSVLSGLWGVYYIRAEYQRGHKLAGQILELAQHAQNPIRLLWAHYMLGEILYNMGEFPLAQTHLTSDLTFYDPRRQAGHTLGAVQDPAMSCLASAALVLWLLGYPDQAMKKQEESLTLARQLNHPFSLVWALSFSLWLAVLRRDAQLVQTQAEVVRLSTEHGFPFWSACATIWHGRAQIEPGSEPVEAQKQAEAGIAQIRQGLAAYQAIGAKAWQSYFLVYLAETNQKAGRIEESLNVLAEASAIVNRTGERMYAAEIHRLKGELLLQGEGEVEAKAEECFWQAIEVARRQQAKSWELRATMSLCRLWQTQRKCEKARQLLAEVYGWFTEGFDTIDLQEAKLLLEALEQKR